MRLSTGMYIDVLCYNKEGINRFRLCKVIGYHIPEVEKDVYIAAEFPLLDKNNWGHDAPHRKTLTDIFEVRWHNHKCLCLKAEYLIREMTTDEVFCELL